MTRHTTGSAGAVPSDWERVDALGRLDPTVLAEPQAAAHRDQTTSLQAPSGSVGRFVDVMLQNGYRRVLLWGVPLQCRPCYSPGNGLASRHARQNRQAKSARRLDARLWRTSQR